ncbi:MAG: DUF72 domain-containing protein [Gemmatimonadetes bacterium]|nr:DUF72 domain-containing protein [Gemmatimonadota bacterium]
MNEPGRIRIGTQGWNYPAWVGAFYPEGTRPHDFLGVYARAFEVVEVDSTFYAVPAAKTVRGWAERTPEGFTFALKMPQEITHERRLRDAGDVVDAFVDAARELGPKLGPVLVQMGPDFVPGELDSLRRFLPTLPRDVRFAVEVRNQRWTRPGVQAELLSLLAEHEAALALSDGRWIPRETMTELALRPTAPFHYVRWMGPNRDVVDYSHVQFPRTEELAAWTQALGRVATNGVEIFGFFNNHFSGHSPATARELQRLLGQRPVDPSLLAEQTSLF